MAGLAHELPGVIHRYCAELARVGIRCQRVLLFGSHAEGRAHEGSDIDLVVVSADWAPYGLRERLEILSAAAARILEPIQARGVTPEEIASGQLSPFWQHVVDELAVEIV
jgi:predicted nucleotidyltransferase